MIDTADKFLNVLLDKNLIELPPIIEPKFLNSMPSNFHYEEFFNYHRVLGHITQNCKALHNIIQDFIYHGAIKINAN